MNTIHLKVGITILVLSAGLISCSQEKKIRDVYQAQSPIIIDGKGSQALKEWDLRKEKSLDLQDAIDVSASQPRRLDVVARCRRDQQNYVESFTFTPHGPLKVFQVMPRALLGRSLTKADCAFELSLFNAAGSRHIFQISTIPITDSLIPEVTLEIPGENQARLEATKLTDVKVRYRNRRPASAELICEELSAPPLPFEQVLEFSHFDFSKPQEMPMQTCRVLISQDGMVQQISRLIEIQMQRSPLKLQSVPVGYHQHSRSTDYVSFVYTTIAASHKVATPQIVLANITIENPSTMTRNLRIAKNPLNVHVEIELATPTEVTSLSAQWLYPAVISAEGASLSENPQYWYVTLEGNGKIMMQMTYKPRPLYCPNHGAAIKGFRVSPTQELVIEELTGQGESFAQTGATIPGPAHWSLQPEPEFQALKRVDSACSF